MARIRAYEPADLPAVYEICLRTGDAGQDAAPLLRDHDLMGHVWAGPWCLLEPEHAFVLEDDEGVAGYVLGALDTRRFEALCEERWWPPLRARYAAPSGDPARWSLDEALADRIHHPRLAPEALVALAPSHLHIDLLPRAQGQGYGRALLTTLFDALRAGGSSGLHLGVHPRNTGAIRFYERCGLVRSAFATDGVVMVRSPL
ncbi:acetyltransferase (GNAT) family protein [Motilibacter rhizosphaerae]|uniref:Acetyltransferase (GNAT) family protein n=1 Tax=Motilibacter rhizosphaerae TaxID=598652 RepID=A0A4Q7NT23_9ACTN|nr:GNAT family N-acetyltransferase [Motilibacter rhizosphaerae]RZS90281.1 acetyltransferase (GNAT) family protein [Motilibacter rhizosphaerae]